MAVLPKGSVLKSLCILVNENDVPNNIDYNVRFVADYTSLYPISDHPSKQQQA